MTQIFVQEMPPARLLRMVVAMCVTELRTFFREYLALALVILIPLGMLLIFANLPGMNDPSEELGGLRAIDAVMAPIAMTIAILVVSLQIVPASLASTRDNGYLRRLSTTPSPAWAILVAYLVIGVVLTLLACAVLFLGGLVVFGVRPPLALGWFLLSLLLAILTMLSISVLIGGLVPNTEWANGVGGLILVPAMFFSGIFIPAEDLPEPLRVVADLLPSGAGLHALRDTWTGQLPEPMHILVMLAALAIIWPIAIRYFRWK